MKETFPVLKSNRLLLRQFLDEDLPDIYKGLSHPEVVKYYGVKYNSLEHAKQQLTFFSDLLKNKTGIWWAVCSHADNLFTAPSA